MTDEARNVLLVDRQRCRPHGCYGEEWYGNLIPLDLSGRCRWAGMSRAELAKAAERAHMANDRAVLRAVRAAIKSRDEDTRTGPEGWR